MPLALSAVSTRQAPRAPTAETPLLEATTLGTRCAPLPTDSVGDTPQARDQHGGCPVRYWYHLWLAPNAFLLFLLLLVLSLHRSTVQSVWYGHMTSPVFAAVFSGLIGVLSLKVIGFRPRCCWLRG